MPVTEQEVSQLKQTGVLFVIGNALVAPFYAVDNRLGVTASVVATLAMVFAFHEEGKKERAKTRAGFFSSPAPSDSGIEGAFNNVLAGAEKVSDQFTGASLKKQ